MVFLWQNNGTGLLFKDQNSNAKERVALAIDFSISIHSEDIVDQSKIPHITLRGGDKMPAIGMGTYHNEIYIPMRRLRRQSMGRFTSVIV